MHERKDSLYDGHHSCLRPRISGNLSRSTHACSPAPKIFAYQSPTPDIRIFPMLVPQHVKEAMITVDGLVIQMEVLASLMVKLLVDGV